LGHLTRRLKNKSLIGYEHDVFGGTLNLCSINHLYRILFLAAIQTIVCLYFGLYNGEMSVVTIQMRSRFSFRRFTDDNDDVSPGDERSTFDVVRFNPLVTSVGDDDNEPSTDDCPSELQPSFHSDQRRLI